MAVCSNQTAGLRVPRDPKKDASPETKRQCRTIRPTSITYPNSRQIDYNYGTASGINDSASRVEAIKDSGTSLAEYGYLDLSSIVKVDYVAPSIRYQLYDPSLSSNIYTGLDRFGRVVDSRWYNHSSSTDTDRIKYGYDRASNRTWRENTVAAAGGKYFDELYSYDGLYRLEDMKRGRVSGDKSSIANRQFEQWWSLDETGNWRRFREDDDGDGTWDLKQTRLANQVNEITNIGTENGSSSLSSMSSASSLSSASSMSSASSSSSAGGSGWVTPSYDATGNMTTMPQPADPEKGYSATYDAWNRLVEIVDDSTSNTVQQNEYDGLGRRVIQKTDTDGSLDETRHYYYSSDWRVVEERVGSSTDPERQFVWGRRYIDDLVCRDRDTSDPPNGTLDESLYCLQDANWNVIAITDSSGTVQERCAYEAYGSPVILDASFGGRGSSNYEWETLYAGYRWDSTVALFNARQRVLLPSLGAWAQRDPIKYFGGSMCLYEYVGASPIMFVDPMGLILVAIDGTGSAKFKKDSGEDYGKGPLQSHVLNFHDDYKGTEKKYFPGPGGLTGEVYGSDCTKIQNEAHKWVCQQWCTKLTLTGERKQIDIVGHSRGGYIAMQLARQLQTQGCNCGGKPGGIPSVRFVGLYDAVDMAKDYPADLDEKEADKLARDVRKWAIVIASSGKGWARSRGEWRRPFPGPGYKADREMPKGVLRVHGTHSAIGGAPWQGDQPEGLTETMDREAAIAADQFVRGQAGWARVPLRRKTRGEYGYDQ